MTQAAVRLSVEDRPEQGAESRRRQIEAAASGLFRTRGYAGTGMREIARALQLQGASLYSHVGSKEDVLFAIVERAADRFEAALSASRDEFTSPSTRLRRMVREHVGVIADDLEDAGVYLQEWRFLGPERRAAILARRDAYEAEFRHVIAAGMASGEFGRVDERLAARNLLSALNGIAGWWRPDGPLDAAQIAEAYADLHLAGLLSAPAPSRPDAKTRSDR